MEGDLKTHPAEPANQPANQSSSLSQPSQLNAAWWFLCSSLFFVGFVGHLACFMALSPLTFLWFCVGNFPCWQKKRECMERDLKTQSYEAASPKPSQASQLVGSRASQPGRQLAKQPFLQFQAKTQWPRIVFYLKCHVSWAWGRPQDGISANNGTCYLFLIR